MSRRASSENSVSLFPFLAVLVCTMGALIMLLLTMTHKIRQQAVAKELALRAAAVPAAEPEPKAETEPEPSPPPQEEPKAVAPTGPTPEEIIAERERRQKGWEKMLSDARAERDKKRRAILRRGQTASEAEVEARALQSQLRELKERSTTAHQAIHSLEKAEGRLKGQEEEVVRQISLTRRNIDLLNRKQTTAANAYALIPYDGTSGTTRRPIYIECTNRGFRFLPEGELLTPEQLDGFNESFNPLLTGAQSLLKFWDDKRRQSGGQEPEPYVLLLVRPSGSLAYYVARKLLAPLNVHMGYELIEEEWKLSTPDADREARETLRDAIAISLEAREKFRRSIGAGKEQGSKFVFNGRQFASGKIPDEMQPQTPGTDESGYLPGMSRAMLPPRLPADSPDGALAPRGSGGAQPSTAGPLRSSTNSATKLEQGTAGAPGGSRFVAATPTSKSGTHGNFGGGSRTGESGGKTGAGANGLTGVSGSGQAGPKGAGGNGTPRHEAGGAHPSGGEPGESGGNGGMEAGHSSGGAPRGNAASAPGEAPSPSGVYGTPRPTEFGRGGRPTKRWGIAHRNGTIGLERKLEINAYSDRLVIGAGEVVISVGRGEKTEELLNRVLMAVEHDSQSWGAPPATFYWIPSIHFVVHPGGNQYYERLRGPLEKWGITSKMQFSLDESAGRGAGGGHS